MCSLLRDLSLDNFPPQNYSVYGNIVYKLLNLIIIQMLLIVNILIF